MTPRSRDQAKSVMLSIITHIQPKERDRELVTKKQTDRAQAIFQDLEFTL